MEHITSSDNSERKVIEDILREKGVPVRNEFIDFIIKLRKLPLMLGVSFPRPAYDVKSEKEKFFLPLAKAGIISYNPVKAKTLSVYLRQNIRHEILRRIVGGKHRSETEIPPELEPLAKEARKYKSAEEFKKAFVDISKLKEQSGGGLRIKVNIPLNKITGLEPQPSPKPSEVKPINIPIEIIYTKTGDYILEAGNHRYWQAKFNKQETIPAYVEFEGGTKSITKFYNLATKGKPDIKGQKEEEHIGI